MSRDEGETFLEGSGEPPGAAEIMRATHQRGALIAVVGFSATGRSALLRYLAEGDGESPPIQLSPRTADNLYEAFRAAIIEHEAPRDQLVLIDDAHEWGATQVTEVLMLALELGTRVVFVVGVPGFVEKVGKLAPALRERIRVFSIDRWSQAELLNLLHRSFGEELSEVEMQEVTLLADGRPEAAVALAKLRIAARKLDAGEDPPHFVVERPGPLKLIIEPGEATAADLARLYAALSDIYRAYGGTGLTFDPEANSVGARAGWVA